MNIKNGENGNQLIFELFQKCLEQAIERDKRVLFSVKSGNSFHLYTSCDAENIKIDEESIWLNNAEVDIVIQKNNVITTKENDEDNVCFVVKAEQLEAHFCFIQ